MRCSFVNFRLIALFVVVVLIMPFAVVLSAQDGEAEALDIPIAATSEPIEATFGSGPFDLLNPAAGLAALSSYRATLSVSFNGTIAGQPAHWSRTYTMLATLTPPARQLTIETADDGAARVFMADIQGTRYERRNSGACIAKPIAAADALAAHWEPAGFLGSIIGADQAGVETVGGVAANRYTFDEAALGAAGIADATGELWIASDGGQIVRYTLTTTGSEAYFGEGVEGTLTWDYTLSEIGQPLTIDIPPDCPPPLPTIAVMPDAVDVFRLPGALSFSIPSDLDAVTAFYEGQVTTSGGQPSGPPMIARNSVVYGFTQGGQPLLLMAFRQDDGSTSVHIRQMPDPSALALTVELPTIVIAPEDTLGDCATGGTPILPDAEEISSIPGIVQYITPATLENAVAFYTEQFAALGADVASQGTISGITMLEATQGYHTIDIVLTQEGARLRISLSSTTGSPVTPATQCATVAGLAAGECEPGGIPILPGTLDVQAMPVMISYTTTASVEDAAAFYEEKIEAAGGQVSSMMPATDMMAMLDVRLDNYSLMVLIGASGGGSNNVSITALTGGALPEPSLCAADAPDTPDSAATEPSSGDSDASCTVSTPSGANQRSGPGTNFALAGALAAGVSVAADGQATGNDGIVWWRLGEGVWVRSDVVNETGNCEALPVVQP